MKKQFTTKCLAAFSAVCILAGAAAMPASAERISSYEAVSSSCESYSERTHDKFFYSFDRTESNEYLTKNRAVDPGFIQEFPVETPDSFEEFDDEEFRLAEKERIRQEIENQIISQMSSKKYASSNLKARATKAAAYKISIPGTFYIYHQDKYNYCVAACVQSVLQYMTKSDPPAQKEIFKQTSTQLYRIPSALQYFSGENYGYAYINAPDTLTMVSCFYTDIESYGNPAFAGIQSTEQNWQYETAAQGHCLVVNAIYSDCSKIQFADPAYSDTLPAFYTEKKDRVRKVVKKIVW